jgi:ABC-2 type transport system permease protein
MTALLALVRRDLLLFGADRRALIVTLAVPIALASIIGFVMGGAGSREMAKIDVLVADLDRSEISQEMTRGLAADPALAVQVAGPEEARERVRRGKAAVAVVIPAGFGESARLAFFGAGDKPPLPLLRDPSRAAEAGLVRGLLTQHAMEAVSRGLFDPQRARTWADDGLRRLDAAPDMDAGERQALSKLLGGVRDYYGRAPAPGASPGGGRQRGGLTIPFALAEEQVTARQGLAYDGYAHAFAGMSVQFVLFLALDGAVALLEQRRRGMWDRIRASPVSRGTVLAARGLSGAILSLGVLGAVMAFGALAFGVRVRGSPTGFLLVLAATAAMSSAFGLLIAALGRTPEATRGLAIFAALVMTMLGGAWFPAFLFPRWMQTATLAVPTRWAMDGLEATTWRGLGLAQAIGPAAALLAFAGLFALLAHLRFRWEAEG